LAACGALIIATLDRSHARVNLVLVRVPAPWRERLERVHALMATLLFAALLAGTIWIAIDLWGGFEESELLHIPYRPLRIATALSLAVLLLLAVRRLWSREDE
jgi:TRAP-type C4-dicarboxylate transport system permease small subunit